MIEVTIKNEVLMLLPEKAIWWKRNSALLVADIHLGKSGHFRKAGIPVPTKLQEEDLSLLADLVERYQPGRLYILGDFFHSELNIDWYLFPVWRKKFPDLEIVLVKGNHDILNDQVLLNAGVIIVKGYLDVFPFRLIHVPPANTTIAGSHYYLSGHIHPGIRLKGRARQSLTMPCFYFSDKQGVLPAFGRFTGNSTIAVNENDKIYPVFSGKVICLNGTD